MMKLVGKGFFNNLNDVSFFMKCFSLVTIHVIFTGENTAWILPFTSGGFIYIALVTVVPDLLDEKHAL